MSYIYISYGDLTETAKDEYITQLSQQLYDEARPIGRALLCNEWYEPTPKTWEEAYVRHNGISYIQWSDYERGEDTKAPDWELIIDEYLREEAEKMLSRAIDHTVVEVVS